MDNPKEAEGKSDCSFSYNSKVDSRAHVRNELWMIHKIMQDVLTNEDSEFDVFTIRCGNSSKPAKDNTTIGYVILRRFLHHAQLQQQYHLPRIDHLRSERAEIISLKIHPLFHNASDIIFRTLAAKTKYYDFYFIQPREVNRDRSEISYILILPYPLLHCRSIFSRTT